MEKNKNTVLKIDNLSVSYGNISAVRDINLKVNQGELVTLVGANGAGKSSLILAILGVIRAKSGSIWFKGKNITSLLVFTTIT